MQIQINSDHNIKIYEALETYVRDLVESALSRVSSHVTRIEIHLSDQNGSKNGVHTKRCMMEARLEGHTPIAVTQQATTWDNAMDGAAEKMTRMIENMQGRLRDLRGDRTDPPLSEASISPEKARTA